MYNIERPQHRTFLAGALPCVGYQAFSDDALVGLGQPVNALRQNSGQNLRHDLLGCGVSVSASKWR